MATKKTGAQRIDVRESLEEEIKNNVKKVVRIEDAQREKRTIGSPRSPKNARTAV